MGETCPQYLFFTEDDLRRPDGAKWVCSPPMRTTADNARLWEGVADGTIQTIGTDHCPFFFDGTKAIMYEGQPVAIPGKELGKGDFTKIPNGLPGIGDRMAVLWTTGVGSGKLTADQFVALNCTNPPKYWAVPAQGRAAARLGRRYCDLGPAEEGQIRRGHVTTAYRLQLYEGWE